jgi:hypothetical protein
VEEELKLAQENAKAAQENARTAQERGIEQGKTIGRIQLLQQLLAQPETPSEELGRLSQDALVQMAESLQRQFSSRKQANGTPPADAT